MSEATVDIIKEIKEAAKTVKARLERLEKENAVLRETVFNHLKTIDQQKDTIESLLQRKAGSELSAINSDTTVLKMQLQSYIEKIDECIASLKIK